jgi:basic membrane lipoprotein Med (substrate-binding protein (PBP1-ABC) superfamily)
MEIPSVTNFNTGFKIGVQYVKPNIKVIATCIGSFEDAAKAKETADALIKHGVDVITHDADQAGLGVIEAADRPNEANGFAIFLPAIFGVEPCIGSNMDGYFRSGFRFAPAAKPIPPAIVAPQSMSISPILKRS